MKELIRQRALTLGFDDCRFTAAAPPDHARQFEQWLAAQWHGEMAYLTRNAPKRVNPEQVLPGARSVITLAASYAGPIGGEEQAAPGPAVQRTASAVRPDAAATSSAATKPLHGVVARYARYTDYHDVLGERLKTLTEFVNELGAAGTRSLWYVDTGPVLERDLAQRAGLGFIGKHTNLISRRLGNWFFLAEILTTLELEPDSSEKNRCGACTRCLSACPTQAIRAPFQLDARRCISYLTIELRGLIPVEWRPAIGARIFGCDDCLAACPWNRFARQGRLLQAHARRGLAQPDLLELLALDDEGFRRRFRDTPLWRIKRRGLLRNVCVALGNVGDRRALPALEKASNDPAPLIAEHARWAIEQIARREQANPPMATGQPN
jgi:epoxyqueuosine reductase